MISLTLEKVMFQVKTFDKYGKLKSVTPPEEAKRMFWRQFKRNRKNWGISGPINIRPIDRQKSVEIKDVQTGYSCDSS